MRFIYTKAFAVFAAVLVGIVLLLILETQGFLDPVRYLILEVPRPIARVVRAVVQPVKNFVTTIYTLRDINRENSRLSSQVHDLQQQVVTLDQYRLENEVLRREMAFSKKTALRLQPCTVLAVDPENISDTLVTDCGAASGAKPGQALISQGYLVAKIIHVGKLTSTAVLITNPESSIDGKLSKNNTPAVIKGSFGSGLVFDLIPQAAEVSPGDLVVTGGISNLIPKNILVGEIGELLSKPNDLFKQTTVISPVTFHDLQFVFLVQE
jgi:rod shape-determining protein MreC